MRQRAYTIASARVSPPPRAQRGRGPPRCRGADGVRRLEGEADGLAEGLEPRVELAAYHPVRALVQVVDSQTRFNGQKP